MPNTRDRKSPEDENLENLFSIVVRDFRDRRHEMLTGLVHYTNFDAFHSIISNNEIWFSPAISMNDYDEIVRGKELIIKFSSDGDALESIFRRIKSFSEELFTKCREDFHSFQLEDAFNTYISCWSSCDIEKRTHDNLTMWRSYTNNGNGVAIVIDPRALGLDEDFAAEVNSCPVFYETEDDFACRSREHLSNYMDQIEKIGLESVLKNIDIATQAFIDICFHLAISHKHTGFVAEKEWRFYWRKHRSNDEKLHSYLTPKLTPRGLFSHFCLRLEPNESVNKTDLDMRRFVKEVMVGPTTDKVLKRNSVEQLLLLNGFDRETTVVSMSDIPFRNF